jgi:hypothetical protein
MDKQGKAMQAFRRLKSFGPIEHHFRRLLLPPHRMSLTALYLGDEKEGFSDHRTYLSQPGLVSSFIKSIAIIRRA